MPPTRTPKEAPTPRRQRRAGDGGGGIHKERKNRSDAGKAHDNPETRLQVACVAWCDAAGILVDGSPGGAAFMRPAAAGLAVPTCSSSRRAPMARTASPWCSRSAATACWTRRWRGLHAHSSRAGAQRWCARARRILVR
ncbi:hypothetical protein Ctob_007632 [Chrysochromulina tobinii]|uniref:Uncharacterized protein n=1 Tax=Chrysochromulina tobinii TaxID=1460289 RepID=A0A0M0JN66_9EUKA|nr:hypothetical protein Ctob_007632 [Chrysochromulina tobinii]|eukprot:KOO28011.1 hypothetical protein Ctob_007632 [Chrysochromulina sp. CCMP291]